MFGEWTSRSGRISNAGPEDIAAGAHRNVISEKCTGRYVWSDTLVRRTYKVLAAPSLLIAETRRFLGRRKSLFTSVKWTGELSLSEPYE